MSAAQSTAVQQLASTDAGFLDRLMGNAGADAQAVAVGKVIDVTSDVVSMGAMAAQLATGIGAPAALVTRAAVATAANAGKKTIMQRIRAKGTQMAKDAAETVAIAAAARQPGGLVDFANALSKGISAEFITGLTHQHKQDSSDGISKDMAIKHDFKASDADALAKSWRANVAQSQSESHSNGQTQTTAVAMDRESLMGLGTRGMNGVSGEEFRRRAESDRMRITAMGEPIRVATAKRQTQVAMAGVSPQNFGGGAMGEALFRFEENLTFANLYKASVASSVLNTDQGAQVGGQVPLVTASAVPAKAGYWQKSPNRKAAPNQQTVDDHFLANWQHVPPTNPQAQAAAKSAGWRYVAPEAARAQRTTLAEYPTQNPPVPLSAADSRDSPLGQIPQGGLGQVGTSPAAKAFIAAANAKNQAAFDSSNPASQELSRVAGGAVKEFRGAQEDAQQKLEAIGAAAVVANALGGLGGNGPPVRGGGASAPPQQTPSKAGKGTGSGAGTGTDQGTGNDTGAGTKDGADQEQSKRPNQTESGKKPSTRKKGRR